MALLTLRKGRPVTRDWIADALWPGAEGGQGLSNLRPLLSELRSALGSETDRLSVSNRTVTFDCDGANVDVFEFDDAIRTGDFARAVGLYKDGLLEGCEDDWAVHERRTREAECLNALQTLGEAALDQGRPDDALAVYTRAIGLDPLRDAPRRGLMSALTASGDVNAALQVYREFARYLSAEVMGSPDEETEQLYERLRSGLRKPSFKDARPVPNNLVQDLSSLVGREDERADIEGLLRRHRLVTLTGVGGIGKTRLAASVASAVMPEHPGGVWFVRLDSIDDEGAIIGAVAGAMGVPDVPQRPLAAGITDRLRTGRALLALDNCEHLLSAVARLIVRLILECPELRVLATSREATGVEGEIVWSVPPLAVPAETNLPTGRATRRRVAEGYEGVRLFVERAKAVHPSFELNDDTLAPVLDVCQQVEGLPLSLELAAARVRTLSVTSLSERLKDHHLETLQGKAHGTADRKSTLRSTLDWSYALLDDHERETMAELSVFSGGWTMEAAEHVCQGDDTAATLQSLVEKSIVVFDRQNDRYRFLETVRQYALEKLAACGRLDSVNSAHRAWCMEFAEIACRGYRSSDQAEWLKKTDNEWPNLRKILDQGDSHPETALRLAAEVWYYWYIRSCREDYHYLRDALARPGADDPRSRAGVLWGIGSIAYSEADCEVSRSTLAESLALFRSLGDTGGTASVLYALGNLARMEQDDDKAIAYYEESLVMLEELGDRYSSALVHHNLASTWVKLDEFDKARASFETGLTHSRDVGSERLVAWALIGLAVLAQRQGEGPRPDLEVEAIDLFEKLGDKRGIAVCLRHQGFGLRRQGAPHLAVAKLEQARDLFDEIGDHSNRAYATTILALVKMDLGEWDEAEDLARDSVRRTREIDERMRIADALYVLGRILRDRRQTAEAWDCAHESLTVRTEILDRAGIVDSLDLIAEMSIGTGDEEKVAFILGASEALRDSVGAKRFEVDEADHQRRRAQARSRLGDESFRSSFGEGRAAGWAAASVRARELTPMPPSVEK